MDSGSQFHPIVMTWPDPDAAIPTTSPPEYEQARVPEIGVNYTFSQAGFNHLLLLPPSSLPDTRPVYFVSVVMNCMNPFSFITTVHRGASDSGPLVGEFEMGISTAPSTVTMGNSQKTIRDAIRVENSQMWTWHFKNDASFHIRWELTNRSTGLFDCYLSSDKRPASPALKIAQFRGAPLHQKGTARTPPTLLRVNPNGQVLFDDILLSILILERWRLRPPAPKTPQTSHYTPEVQWWS
ncbi:hypothetical protein C8R46DRAFT_1063103 [Mycena filopes]|nr:hypothetical protein C8R46DRAFT_1063103 [Mycena filopes]